MLAVSAIFVPLHTMSTMSCFDRGETHYGKYGRDPQGDDGLSISAIDRRFAFP